MIWFWSILVGLCVGTLWGEAWIRWRSKPIPQPRHANEPTGTAMEWFRREPVDLDNADHPAKP